MEFESNQFKSRKIPEIRKLTKYHCSRQVLPPATPPSLTAHSGHCARRPSRTIGLTSSSSLPLFPSVDPSTFCPLLCPETEPPSPWFELAASPPCPNLPSLVASSKKTSPESISPSPPFTGHPPLSDELHLPGFILEHVWYHQLPRGKVMLMLPLVLPLAVFSHRNA
ncbi:hypothetical protein EJB05_32055, partial [Eragrostis curvula]